MKALYYAKTLKDIPVEFDEEYVTDLAQEVNKFESENPDYEFYLLDVIYNHDTGCYAIEPLFIRKKK